MPRPTPKAPWAPRLKWCGTTTARRVTNPSTCSPRTAAASAAARRHSAGVSAFRARASLDRCMSLLLTFGRGTAPGGWVEAVACPYLRAGRGCGSHELRNRLRGEHAAGADDHEGRER